MFTPIKEKGTNAPQRFPIARGADNTEHWTNLIACARAGRKDTWSPADLAFRTQTVLHMAMTSMRKGVTASFDPKQRRIVG